MVEVMDKPAPKVDPARVMQVVEKARWAAASYATYPQAAVMPIVAAVARAAAAEARRYAEWAVEETGFGIVEHKESRSSGGSLPPIWARRPAVGATCRSRGCTR